MKLELLTFNIHKGFDQFKNFTLHEMQQALADISTDIVCLQEIQGEHQKHQATIKSWPEQSQIEFLAADNWPHYVYGKNVSRKKRDHGNAVLSKYEITKSENIDISSSIFSSRGLLHAIIPVEDVQLHIMCTHLGLLKSEREEQYHQLTQRIAEHVADHEPLIIAGDFNDWLMQAEQFLCQDLQLKEVFMELHGEHAKSFPAIRPTLSVDRIYYRNIEPISCQALASDPWHKLSDHIPLIMQFNLKTAAATK